MQKPSTPARPLVSGRLRANAWAALASCTAPAWSSRLDQAGAVQDASAALAFARNLPETSGRAGVLGFCMGGRLAYQLAAAADPDVLVSYYGSGIASQLDSAPHITAPTIFHFGD